MNTNTDRTGVVTEHVHTYRKTRGTLTLFADSERKIVGSGRFKCCWLVPKTKEREAIVRTVRHETGCCSFRGYCCPNPNAYAQEQRAYLRSESIREKIFILPSL
jgi:hypothetical protein